MDENKENENLRHSGVTPGKDAGEPDAAFFQDKTLGGSTQNDGEGLIDQTEYGDTLNSDAQMFLNKTDYGGLDTPAPGVFMNNPTAAGNKPPSGMFLNQTDCGDVGTPGNIKFDKTLDGPTDHPSQFERRRVVAAMTEAYDQRYNIRGTVGQGGIGRVLLGFDKELEREVAIKELIPEKESSKSDKTMGRFLREARITGQLEHPGVIPVYELGERPDGSRYYVMKYVRGRTLEQAIEECADDSREEAFRKRMALLDHIINVCDCMAYAHSKGIIHRDLKPGNIIIGEFGETIILDWGLARHLQKDKEDQPEYHTPASEEYAGIDVTQEGEILGTPAYMAPEQANNALGQVDQSTDVYSLGTILFNLLTGRLPFQSTTLMEQFKALLQTPTPAARDFEELVPPELSAICEKAMAKNQLGRFVDAGKLAEQLRAYRDGRLVSVYAYTRTELVRRFIQRNKGLVAAMFLATCAVIAGSVMSVHYGVKAGKMRDKAITERSEAQAARKKAENALVEVTDLSKFVLAYSRKAAEEIEDYFASVTRDMNQCAQWIAQKDISKREEVEPHLKELLEKHPEVESFMTILPPGTIGPVWPPEYQNIEGIDISKQEHIRWIFHNKKPVFSRVFKAVEGFWAITIQVPVMQGDELVGTLATVMKTGPVIGSALSAHLDKGGIWCMQDNGYILFDSDPNQIGRYLFNDQMYDNFPELRSMGRRMLLEATGIGMYKFKGYQGEGTTYKVAAWHTLKPCNGVSWKIIVVQPYRVR